MFYYERHYFQDWILILLELNKVHLAQASWALSTLHACSIFITSSVKHQASTLHCELPTTFGKWMNLSILTLLKSYHFVLTKEQGWLILNNEYVDDVTNLRQVSCVRKRNIQNFTSLCNDYRTLSNSPPFQEITRLQQNTIGSPFALISHSHDHDEQYIRLWCFFFFPFRAHIVRFKL